MLRLVAAFLEFMDLLEILGNSARPAEAGCLCAGAAGRDWGQVSQLGGKSLRESPGQGKWF